MLKYLILPLFFLSSLSGISQQTKVDSVRNLLDNHKYGDTVRVTLLRDLAAAILSDTVHDEVLTIGNEILDLSNNLNYAEGIVYGYLTNAWYYEKIDDFNGARDSFINATQSAKLYNSNRLLYRAYIQLGRYYERQSIVDSSLLFFRKAYVLVKNKKDKRVGNVLFQISINFYYKAQFDSVINYAKKGLKIQQTVNDSSIARSLANILAAALKRKGELDSALYYFNIAIDYAENSNDKFAMLRVYNNIANIYGDRGNYPKALDYYLLTLKAAEEGNLASVRAVTYNNIAIVYYTLKDYPETISYLLKSLAISDSIGDHDNIINALNNIGELYFKIDSIDKSFDYYNRAEKLIENSDNKFYSLYNYLGKGLLYDRVGITDSALDYLEKALKIAREIDSKMDLAATNVALAKHYFLKKKYVKSAHYAKTGFNYAKEVGSVETIRDAAEVLHKANAKLVKHKDAYQFLKIYTEMNDSLLNQDNTKEITQMEMRYVHDKEMQEMEAQEAIRELQQEREIAKQKGLRNAFIMAFILVLVIIVIVVRSIKQKQRANQ
ncbi:MAG: hypothetical protein C0599_06225, partial [Salinivirgaceae bacterium]